MYTSAVGSLHSIALFNRDKQLIFHTEVLSIQLKSVFFSFFLFQKSRAVEEGIKNTQKKKLPVRR